MIEEPHERLKKARIEAGYATASDAAIALGVRVPTYIHHENGRAGFSRHAERYARIFDVRIEWLMTGKGDMRQRRELARRVIPVHGLVGAGAAVEMVGSTSDIVPPDEIEMPGDGEIAALVVHGDSQWPRFMDGEYVLYDPRPTTPGELVGRYAIVQTYDGRRLIKILRRANKGGDNRWRLESHNAPPENDVLLIGAWRYLGVLPSR